MGSIAFSDIDNDNDPDVLISGQPNNSVAATELYLNDGSGNFTTVPQTPFMDVFYGFNAFEDVENDGDQDVVITGFVDLSNTSFSGMYINDGTGSFSPSNVTLVQLSNSDVKFADINNDSDSDLLMIGGNTTGLYTLLYLNQSVLNTSDFEKGNRRLTAYPNPTMGKLFITNRNKIQLHRATVFDAQGRKIKEFRFDKIQNEYSLDLRAFQNGIYLLQLFSENGRFVEQIVKQ